MDSDQIRIYDRSQSVVFLKTHEAFGGLSNMAGGFPLKVNGLRILTSEALYQACRFPHLPEVQRLIIGQNSPMTAKMKSKKYRDDSRLDWDRVRVKIMRWCLRVKLAQNWNTFSTLLLETGDRPIVEQSRKDDFWGAKPVDESTLVGMNVLGRLLMELREAVQNCDKDSLLQVEPLPIPDFLLDKRPIHLLSALDHQKQETLERGKGPIAAATGILQPSLIEQPMKGMPVPYLAVDQAEELTSTRLKPYPAYKDSGVPWLGEIPEHWSVRRIKTLLKEIDKRSPDGRGSLLSLSKVRGLVPQSEVTNKLPSAATLIGYKACSPNQVVMNRMQAWNGVFARATADGLVSPDYAVFAPIGMVNTTFLVHVFRIPLLVSQFKNESKGIGTGFNRLYTDRFGAIPIPCPSLEEQAAIVRFLDYADRRIRRYIATKRKLIALLNEQKQAIIHRAVTRGLDPNVRLKPSGVEWLGDVPEHWEVHPAKYFYREIDERSATGTEELLSVSHITGVTPRSQKNITMFMASSYVGHKLCQPGDLVINTMWAWMAALGIAKHTGIVSSSYGVYRPIGGTKLLGDYADLLLRTPSYVSEYVCRSTGIRSSRLRLYPEHFLRIKLICPPIEEQREILQAVKGQTATMEGAISRAQREIDLIREYRTRMIADVVTGKLDVRAAAASLTIESDEVEPFNEDMPLDDDEETIEMEDKEEHLA